MVHGTFGVGHHDAAHVSGAHIVVQSVRLGTLRSWRILIKDDEGRREATRIVQRDDVWYVRQPGGRFKCRPYEALLWFPSAYRFLHQSELTFIQSTRELAGATRESLDSKTATFRLEHAPERHEAMERISREIGREVRTSRAGGGTAAVRDLVQRAQRGLEEGQLVRVRTDLGLVLEREPGALSTRVSDFAWWSIEDAQTALKVSDEGWTNRLEGIPTGNLGECVAIYYDQYATNTEAVQPEAYLLDLVTEEIQRVPYQGFGGMAGGFSEDRGTVLLSVCRPDWRWQVTSVDLRTRASVDLLPADDPGTATLVCGRSPNGADWTCIRPAEAPASFLDSQIFLLNVAQRTLRPLGEPGRIGTPAEWLPDGSGLILKRFASTSTPNDVEPRVLVRLGLDGRLQDLRPGDWPVVHHRHRKILYRDDSSGLWHLCELDGSKPELYADGLAGFGQPTLSPDGGRIIFVKFEDGKLPTPMLFTWGSANGRALTKAPGYIGMPIWR
ncbi:MAG: TolB family protein [Limisphaerales bacterium]